jgi:hypothetical protein
MIALSTEPAMMPRAAWRRRFGPSALMQWAFDLELGDTASRLRCEFKDIHDLPDSPRGAIPARFLLGNIAARIWAVEIRHELQPTRCSGRDRRMPSEVIARQLRYYAGETLEVHNSRLF